VKGQITFKTQMTPRDQVLEILVFLTLFSASLQCTRFLREEWNKKQSSDNEMQSSKELPPQKKKKKVNF